MTAAVLPPRNHPEYMRMWRSVNRERINAQNRARYASNPKKHRTYKKRWRALDPEKQRAEKLRQRYGITVAEYDALFARQKGRCAICGTTDPGGFGKRLSVDHDATTGTVRGLLCFFCNAAIGKFAHAPERLRAAADYLEAPR